MTNVIEFKKLAHNAKLPPRTPTHMFDLGMYQDENGEYEVYMEMNDEVFSDFDIYVAMECATAKYAQEHGFLTYEIESEDDDIKNR